MIHRATFYDRIRAVVGPLTQANVNGFNRCLDEIDRRGTLPPFAAYILATAWWESGKTMQPVREAYWLSEAFRKKHLRYWPYYGRGLVQLTWRANYKKASDLYGVDFVNNPDLALNPEYSVRILFDGMEEGWFTGRDLGEFIDDIDESDDEDLREYMEARRVVNGTDWAEAIGKLALGFEAALRAAERPPDGMPAPAAPKAPWWAFFVDLLRRLFT